MNKNVLNKNGTSQAQFQGIDFLISISSFSKEKTHLIVIKYRQYPYFICNVSHSFLKSRRYLATLS